MNLQDFEASFGTPVAPEGASGPLTALWFAARGAWDDAHKLVQDESSAEAAWVHAHLHRVEGDLSNAAYWYRRAGRPIAEGELVQERRAIAETLLQGQD